MLKPETDIHQSYNMLVAEMSACQMGPNGLRLETGWDTTGTVCHHSEHSFGPILGLRRIFYMSPPAS